MNLKIVIMISMFLAQILPSEGLEPIYLGSGPRDQVINLDAGASQPRQSYNFAPSGFVTPIIPQTMALSSNIMITQARKLMNEAQLARNETVSAREETVSAREETVSARDESVSARDESVSARDEAKAILNETRALHEEINRKEQNIQSLQKRAEADREATAASAAQAGSFLNKTDEIFRMIMVLSGEIDDNLREIKATLLEARAYANTIDTSNATLSDASTDASTDEVDVDDSVTTANFEGRSVPPTNRESENREERTIFFLS